MIPVLLYHQGFKYLFSKAFILAWTKTYQPTGNPINENKLEPVWISYAVIAKHFSEAEKSRIENCLLSITGKLQSKTKIPMNNWQAKKIIILGTIGLENFFATAPPPPFMADKTPHKVVIHYHHKTHVLQVAYPHNILEVALKHNIELPYSCRGGRCSTCTARCISGSVKMTINDVLTPKDLQDGLILTCVSYPETDVELSFTPSAADNIL